MTSFQQDTQRQWKFPSFLKCSKKASLVIVSLILFSCDFNNPSERRLFSENTPCTCIWSPGNTEECDQMLSERLPPPTTYRMKSDQEVERRRLLLFGDSTMGRLHVYSPLRMILNPEVGQGECPIEDIICSEKVEALEDRCSMHQTFGLNRTDKWIMPDHDRIEGPASFGFMNRYCKDCGSCMTQFHECLHKPVGEDDSGLQLQSDNNQCIKKRQVYGGYFSMNFARDVELQTPEFLTTQENYVAYINRKWNTPDLVRDWGKPVCIMSAGIHDMILRFNKIIRGDNDVEEKFQENVNWILTLFLPVCDHIIWLGNTANGYEKNNTMFPLPVFKTQTMKGMKKVDTEVKEVIETNPKFQTMVSFIDVHEASLFHPHDDFVHLDTKWYGHLGTWISQFFT